MSRTLCFDFGNTRLKVALFHGGQMQEVITLENDGTDTILQLLERTKADRSILSSVINHNPEIENLLSQKTQFHKLNHHSRLPLLHL
jgi:type III pantothenate kinase